MTECRVKGGSRDGGEWLGVEEGESALKTIIVKLEYANCQSAKDKMP